VTASTSEFQRRATKEGRLAQQTAESVISGAGFEVLERNKRLPHLGVTVNFICSDRRGQHWHFDVSGSYSSDRAGLIRTDTMWKTLGRANVLSGAGITKLILLTSNLPMPGSVGDTAMHCAKDTFFDAIEISSPNGKARLRHYAEGGSIQRALPGFWNLQDAYGNKLKRGDVAGASLSLPLAITGDPLGSLLGLAVEGMGHRLKVYLPSKTKDGKRITPNKRSDIASQVKTILSGMAGGCTSQQGKGTWVDPFTGVVDERVELVETYSKNRVPDGKLREIVDLILIDLDQSAAAVVMDQQMLHFSR
jgi:hypothetical protein